MSNFNHLTALASLNQVRTMYQKPPMALCEDCSKSAQQLANNIAQSGGNVQHGCLSDTHGNMGQNIALGGKNFTFEKALAAWMQEESMYNGGNNYQHGCGHFTQVVWKATTHIGVGVAKFGNKTVIVANFHPPGNVNNQFLSNV
jgi:glioma pathogenesis-related protein 2